MGHRIDARRGRVARAVACVDGSLMERPAGPAQAGRMTDDLDIVLVQLALIGGAAEAV
ncbi:MAG TPA: hypothetical protein VI318_12490 [Baekduia sp.]